MSYVAVVMQPASSHITKVISAATSRPGPRKSSTCGRNSAGHPRCPPRAVRDTSVLSTKESLYGLGSGVEHPVNLVPGAWAGGHRGGLRRVASESAGVGPPRRPERMGP